MFNISQTAYDTDNLFFFVPPVNAADNKQRDASMSCIKINIDVWV